MSEIVGIIDVKNDISFDKINGMVDKISNNKSVDVNIFRPMPGCYFALTFSDNPTYNEDKTLVLYFNGQVYNYKELSEKLKNKGHSFSTECKSEVVMHLFEEYGKESLKYLDGMFSFCIVNTLTKSVFIARDKYGMKPMYYSFYDNSLILSSNLKAIIDSKKKNRINKMAVELYTNLRFVPAPYTIIEDIHKLKAGEYLIFENGKIETNNYIKYNQVYECFDSKDMSKIITENILSSCVHNNDKEIGVFLSGGLDSTIVASTLKKANKKIKTFSVGYEVNTEDDETGVAKKIAAELAVDNYCYTLRNDELIKLLNETVRCLNEPLYSTVSMPTLKLSKLADKKVKVVLTGDGSDEIFFGYKYLIESLNKPNIEENYLNGIGWLKKTKYIDLFIQTNLTEREIKKLLFEGCDTNNFSETFRRIELYKRLSDYHFPRVERLTNAYGLEAKAPFLRKNIVEYMLSINSDKLINDIEPKKILKECMDLYLPSTVKDRGKKPFTAPTKQWVENVFWEDLKKLFQNKELVDLCGFNRFTINNLLYKYTGDYSDVSEIWGIYMLLKWVEQNMTNIA